MEDIIKIEQSNESKIKGQGIGVPYPIETIDEVLNSAKIIVDEYGTSKPISKEEFSRTLNKKVASLSLFFSSLVQYSVFNLVHGKGYIPTDLYRRYTEPVHDNDEYKYKLEMFKSAPLYIKIVENLNGHTLPSDEKRVANLLKGDPYNVNPNSSEKAAKIFIENCRDLNLRDSMGKFKFPDLSNLNKVEKTPHLQENLNEHKPFVNIIPQNEELFELPIPLPNKRRAYLKYPIDNLTKKDINVITKALEFIASSLDDE